MTRKFIRYCAVLLLLVSFSLVIAEGAGVLRPAAYYRDIAQYFSLNFPYQHLRQVPLDDRISAQAWTNYIASLDYERVYFLESDIERLSVYRTEIDDQLRHGKMDMAFDAFKIFRWRVAERSSFVTNQLAKGFDFKRDEEYRWKRRDAQWPSDIEEQDDLWRKRLKNDILRLTVPSIVATNAASGSPGEGGGLSGVTNLVVSSGVTNAVSSGGEESSTTNAPPFDPYNVLSKRYEQLEISVEDSDSEWVLQRYMTAIASAFDPHSSYMSPTTLEDFEIDMKLSLVGIGALLRPEDGAAKIVSLIPGGPAARDQRPIALEPGDKIIGVGQGKGEVKDILHLPLNKIVRQIRGKKGTTVVLRVLGVDELSTRLVDIVREEVKLEEQAADSEVIEIEQNGRTFRLGVIDLPTFYANMHQSSEDAEDYRSASYDVSGILESMNTNNVDGIILDLRGNGGGSLREAIDMTGLFISRGPVVQVREPRRIHILPDQDPSVVWRKPMLVMIDRLSASASEIVAGALQDYGRAVLVGDSHTHGKGSVQTIRTLGEDPRFGSIKVTTASYYRISGASTQLKGVSPDIVIPSAYDSMDLGESELPNPMPWTMVAPADYEKVSEVGPVVRELRLRSELRRADDKEFDRHNRLLKRVKRLNETQMVSLNRAERVREAMVEKALDETGEAELGDVGDGAKSKKGKDIIRGEALRILADLIFLQGAQGSLAGSADTPERLSDALFQRVFGL